MIEVYGFIAGLLSCLCWLPQLIQIIRTKDTKSFSFLTIIIYTLTQVFWVLFSLSAGAWLATIFNFGCVLLSLGILYYKFKFDFTFIRF